MRRTLALLAALALTAALAAVAGAHDRHGYGHHGDDRQNRPFTYAVIGDTPYGQAQLDNFANDVAEINADPQVRLAMHLGDIKNGSSECSTAYFETVRAGFDLFADPLVYTPGDNEWTDCHRANNGGYWPAGPVLNGDTRPARLEEIRRVFFDRPGWTRGQRPRRVEAQFRYPENVLWQDSRVQFGALHVVGSDNDWAPWFGQPQTSSQIDEVEGRMKADLWWLHRIFDRARDSRARAVVIGMQADMWHPGVVSNPAFHAHFQPIAEALAREASRFRGEVLLLDGDTHAFVDDRPLADPAHPEYKSAYGIEQDVPNLRRITVNGSTVPCHEWLKLTVDPRAGDVFSYERVRFAKQPGLDPAVCPES